VEFVSFFNKLTFFACTLFSRYKSCDNTQEDWSFVLLIKKSACKYENAEPPGYWHMICIGKTKCTSEKGLLIHVFFITVPEGEDIVYILLAWFRSVVSALFQFQL